MQVTPFETFEYVEGYYDTQCKHSAIGYKTPSQFETHFDPAK